MLKKLFPWLSLLSVTLVGLELLSYVGVRLLQDRLVFYNPPHISTYPDYMESRDPVLGWPSKKKLRENHDTTGSRPIPAYPTPGEACISLYGDSFTWSDAVGDAEAWSNQLSLLQGCRVSNYGVPGFGTDQAFMRFEQNVRDEAPVVLLNHFTGDIRRNVTQFRNLTSDDIHFLFKPRFILVGGSLQLIPLPSPTLEEAERIAAAPEKFLPHEHFVPYGPTGIAKAHFPYLVSLLRASGNEHLRAKLKGVPVWKAYYHPDHQSGALPLTAAVLRRFASVAQARGKQPIVTVIPNAHDLSYFQKTGRWAYRPLLDALAGDQIELLDLGPGLLDRQRDRDICKIMEEKSCYGHYNARGYRILAELVDEYLRNRRR